MKTYKFESVIQDGGVIRLPNYMRKLKKHRVKLTIVDLETVSDSPIDLLADITQKYANVNETDLDIPEIYAHREKQHDRGLVFD